VILKKSQKNLGNKLSHVLDEMVAIVSPERAVKRQRMRDVYQTNAALSSYRAARRSRLKNDYTISHGSADEDHFPDLEELRQRSRGLFRNNGTASSVMSTMITNIISSGVRPQSRVDTASLGIDTENEGNRKSIDKFQSEAESVWRRWMPFVDSQGTEFMELETLIFRSILENGEVIVLPIRIKDPNRPFSLALEIVESDRLETPQGLENDKSIRRGVKLGSRGEPIGYWINKVHPGDVTLSSRIEDFVFIDAKDSLGNPKVIHLFHKLRTGQTRGIPFLTTVLHLFRDLEQYMEAELIAARIAACLALFIETPDPMSTVTGATDEIKNSQPLTNWEPGMIRYGAPGEKIHTVNPQRQSSNFSGFVDELIKFVSAGVGLPGILITKDFSQVNFSSARAALLQAGRFFTAERKWLGVKFYQPVWTMLQ